MSFKQVQEDKMWFKVVCTVFVGVFLFLSSDAQSVLTTKCPSNQWTQHLGKCYLVVNYTHSWHVALRFCNRYNAKLAEPKGYVLTEWLKQQILSKSPAATSLWTGYNRFGIASSASYMGRWSDGTATSVEIGVWGPGEPITTHGQCAYFETANGKWYIGSCNAIRPFACEMNPCPSGIRNTFMCNGKCIGNQLVCDGKDDCGNNADELNCAGRCTYLYEGTSGEINLPEGTGFYLPNTSCLWTIRSPIGSRISVEFEEFETEADTDVVELLDGGPVPGSSNVTVRLSGSQAGYTYTSSYNTLILRFVSDSNLQKSGFRLTWTTNNICKYNHLPGYNFTNSEIVYRSSRLTSAFTQDRCKSDCDGYTDCIGFRYTPSDRMCHFFNLYPILTKGTGVDLYITSCPPGNTFQASGQVLQASASPQQLTTPLYPYFYLGNMELHYTITAQKNFLISLNVLTLNLCCGDYIDILAKDGSQLERLTSDSNPHLIISTSNTVQVRMILEQHWKCTGALIQYTQGCDNSVSGTGRITSPGYFAVGGYEDYHICTWTIRALSNDRSVTLRFDDFELHSSDSVKLTYSNGSSSLHTNTELREQSRTASQYLNVTLTSSSLDRSRGFSISYSPGCARLNTGEYVLSSTNFNFGDFVDVSCRTGFYFTDEYSGQTEMRLYCLYGGNWNIFPLPSCKQGYCGKAPAINHGYIVNATGVQGGDSVTYRCNDGFIMSGNAQITCLSNNQWQSVPTCSSGICSSSSLFSDSFLTADVVYGDGINHRSIVNLTCPRYYQLIGPRTVQCRQGSWDFLNNVQTSCQRKPCETPLIDNSYLFPQPNYTENQAIFVTCKTGYQLQGNSTIYCGVTTILPYCTVVQCSLTDYPHVRATNAGGSVFNFGTTVTVGCDTGYEMAGVTTSSLDITCTGTGAWTAIPTCQRLDCGQPVSVNGSQYMFLNGTNCLGYGCMFTFSCRPRYERFGGSVAFNDNIVRCGGVNLGIWDFGNLHCEGGQCPDPGYPPSGRLVGSSFEEGATVMFECLQQGYQPVHTNGTVYDRITCRYDAGTNTMKWDGIVPVCKDTQDPIFDNCPSRSLSISMLDAPNFDIPQARDNNAIQHLQIFPEGFRPSEHLAISLIVYYQAYDYANNYATCQVSIKIPRPMECNNMGTTITLYGNATIQANSNLYFSQLDSTAQIDFSKLTINVVASAETLRIPTEVFVNTTVQGVRYNCTLQFRFVQGPGCNDWSLDTPNAVKTCTSGQCTITCKQNYYFINQPSAQSITLGCVNGAWNQTTPICAASTSSYVIYAASYNYKYFVETGVVNTNACVSQYQINVRNNLERFANVMETSCSRISPLNSFSIALKSITLNLGPDMKRVYVLFDYIINVTDETVYNVQALKDNCSEIIQSSLNTQLNIETIRNLTDTSGNCGFGVYDLPSITPSFSYQCEGNRRRFFNNNGIRMCLTCPPGYQYNSTITRCQLCPEGTYSSETSQGMECLTCPGNLNPGLVGLKTQAECSIKSKCPPGTFSKDGLSPCRICPKNFFSSSYSSISCTPCAENEVTLQEGSNSSLLCLSQTAAQARPESSPCKPNPCANNGGCTYKRSAYYCTCPQGFTGDRCESVYTLCSSNPCQNDATCSLNSDGSNYTCSCNTPASDTSELSGRYCEVDRYGCSSSFCSNNGTCHNAHGSFRCMCPSTSGYNNGEKNVSETGICRTENSPCAISPCMNGGLCFAHGHYYRTCVCEAGFTGLSCEHNITTCRSNTCQNGGLCISKLDDFECQCPEGFHGKNCQFVKACMTSCSAATTTLCHRCKIESTDICTNIGNSYECTCKPGYTGDSCETLISACNSYPCKHGGTCVSTSMFSYTCQCPPPWTGLICDQETSHCPNGNQCFNSGLCYSSTSGYVCSCATGYIGTNCTERYNVCDRTQPCVTGRGTCSVTGAGDTTCTCTSGYSGASCQNVLPACSTSPCQHGGTCSDTTGSVICTCPEGYTGGSCETTINLCESSPCGPNEICIPALGSYTCVCTTGKRGENCDKDVDGKFEYIISSRRLCRVEASTSRFNQLGTPLLAMTVAFRVRYTQRHGDGVIMTVLGSLTDEGDIPSVPDLIWMFSSTQVLVETTNTGGRRKRATHTLTYQSDITDGQWHHLVLSWAATPGELTLYVDGTLASQEYFSMDEPLARRGFLVFGHFDAGLGYTIPENSFEGRISNLHVLNKDQNADAILAYDRDYVPSWDILNEAVTTMRLYSTTYILTCQGTACPSTTGVVTPAVENCPIDHLVVTARTEVPTLPNVTFSGQGITVPISNFNVGQPMDWGLHGIVVAVVDSSSSAAVCSYVLYNREVDCGSSPSAAQCSTSGSSGVRCTARCSSSQYVAGLYPQYQTCSRYSMWTQDVMHTSYTFPSCSATRTLTQNVTLDLTLTTNPTCQTVRSQYSTSTLQKMNTFNQGASGWLCTGDCASSVTYTFTCTGSNTMAAHLEFSLLRATGTYDSMTLTAEQMLKVAVGDEQVFTYVSGDGTMTVMPEVTSFAVTSPPTCASGYEVSGDICVSCGSGTRYDPVTRKCELCPLGTYSTSGVSCEPCFTSQTTGLPGAQGPTYCKDKCIAGWYYNENVGECQPCPLGFYQPAVGMFFCQPCPATKTTETSGRTSNSACVDPVTITTTEESTPNVGAATEAGGLSAGVIVAIVLGILVFLLIVFLILAFCCCQGIFPCFDKKKQVVAPAVREGYYAHKYGDVDMRFVNYNLTDVRERKGRPLDRVPIVDSADETASVKTDHSLSFHVPVFLEKLDGSVHKKQLYMSNGGQTLNNTAAPRSHRMTLEPMTSSPRGGSYQHYDQEPDEAVDHRKKRRRRKKHRDHSGHHGDHSGQWTDRHSHHHHGNEFNEPQVSQVSRKPKDLAPRPTHIRSLPPSETVLMTEYIRPSSALNQRRQQVDPSQYEEFLEPARSSKRSHHHSSRDRPHHDRESRDRASRHRSEDELYDPQVQTTNVQNIVVESDEDLR